MFLLVALSVGTMLAGCRKGAEAQTDILIAHEITPQPPVVGVTATVSLKVTDKAGRNVTGAKVKIEGNMSHAGMAPVFAEAGEVAPGRYQAHIAFSMSGDWVLLVDLTLPDGRKLQRQLEVKGVRPDDG
ncbi:MAG TPA: FixH family protein [Pyrinomonadaceae bacterium]|jgi:hypothetical protein|nr:FixH family protein [Pyrinomonadaceae bacterium]